eukprot:10211167-Alexandrium_andersonii.AAC.1
METEPTYQQRLRSLPKVPKFGPGCPGFTPPMAGSVAAATPIAPPRPKVRLLSWRDVQERKDREA